MAFKFKDSLGTDYLAVRSIIRADRSTSAATHYLLVCVSIKDVFALTSSLDTEFSGLYNVIFYVVIGIAAFTFILITVMIYWRLRTTSRKINAIAGLLAKILHRGLFPYVTQGLDYARIQREGRGLAGLGAACILKISSIEDLENQYCYFGWNFTRPHDEFLYDKWKRILYPTTTEKTMSWRGVLPKLSPINIVSGKFENGFYN